MATTYEDPWLEPARIEALNRGDTRYETCIRCPKGHITERYVKDTRCCTCREDWQRRQTKRNRERRMREKLRELRDR